MAASRPAHQPCFAPSRATAVLMDADNGSVDHLDGAVMAFGEGLHDQVPDASHPPTNKPVVAGRVRPKALRQIAPWRARPQYPEDAVEDTSVVDPRHAARLVRKERPDGSPLKVREFVSHNSRPRFGSLNHAYLGVRNAELQVRDGPDSGHAADMSKTTRMTQHRTWIKHRFFCGSIGPFRCKLDPLRCRQIEAGGDRQE